LTKRGVLKNVTLLSEKRDVAILSLRDEVMLLGEKRDVAILRVRNELTLMRESGTWLN
jgi:hypothetical protein